MSTSRIGISEILIVAGVGYSTILLTNGTLSDLVRRLLLLVKESPKYEDGADGEDGVDSTDAQLLVKGSPNSGDQAEGEDVDSADAQDEIERMEAFKELPEGCIAAILSRTTPIDVGRLSLVSKTFLSAANSDIVWNHFLPADSQFIDSIISQYPSLATAPTKKALYLALSDHTIIIDHAEKSFQLDKKSGKKCYMLAARALTIDCGGMPPLGEKEWIHMQNSRFPEVAKLCRVLSLEIRGMINTLSLSPNTKYAAYLVFKMIDARGFKDTPVELSVGIEGGRCSTKLVCLERWLHNKVTHHVCSLKPNSKHKCKCAAPGWRSRNRGRLGRPRLRIDGWLEIKMGEFFNSSLEDEEVYMSVIEKKSSEIKENLFLQGIEIRPAKDN